MYAKFFIYANDGNETFGTLIHAENLIKYGHLNSFMTDESTGTMLAQHPITHLSQGNWPRIPVAILKLFHLSDQYVIFSLILTLNLICIYAIYKVLTPKTSKEFALIFIFTLFFNYLHFIQWSLNLYRVWQSVSFFIMVFLLTKVNNQNRNKPVMYFLLIVYSATIGYGELVYAFWLLVSLTCLILLGFFSSKLRLKIEQLLIILVGIGTGLVSHIIQGTKFIGLENFATYFFNILRIRNGNNTASHLSSIIEQYNIVFWENFGIQSQGFIDQVRILIQNLTNLVSYSYIVQYSLPLILVLLFMCFKSHKIIVQLGLILSFYLLINSNSALRIFLLIIIAISILLYVLHKRFFDKIYGLSLIAIVGVSFLSVLLPTRTVLNQNLTSFITTLLSFCLLFLLILRLKTLKLLEVFRQLNTYVIKLKFEHKTQVLSLSLFTIWLQSKVSEQILNFIYSQSQGIEIYFVIFFTLLYVYCLVLLPFSSEFIFPNSISNIAKFLLAPTVGLIIVYIFSPGYLLTGYLVREDLLWKGFFVGYISFFIYLSFINIRRFTFVSGRTLSLGFIVSFIALYSMNQLIIEKIQPIDAFKAISSHIQNEKYGKVIYSNSYSLPISYLTETYSGVFSPSQLISFFESTNGLNQNYSFRFPNRTDIFYKNYDSYILLDIPVNFDKSISRFFESNGKPMPPSSYCEIVYDRDFAKHYNSLRLSNQNRNGHIGKYGYWCEFEFTLG